MVVVVFTFFRRCPNCGKMFGVRQLEKTLLTDEVHTYEVRAPPASARDVRRMESVTEEIRDFRVTFECLKCGHKWSQETEENSRK